MDNYKKQLLEITLLGKLNDVKIYYSGYENEFDVFVENDYIGFVETSKKAECCCRCGCCCC